MRLIGVMAEAALTVLFVFAVITVKIFDVRVAFEREYVRRNAVEEPAVVAYYDGAAREIFERLLQRSHRVHI
jgi:hypothetical protein